MIQQNSILEQQCFTAIVTYTDTDKAISNQFNIHFNYSHFNKFEAIEKYMKKTSFLLKFIDINYENCTINFDYDSLNAFDEKKWIKEVQKYNIRLYNKDEGNNNKDETKAGSNSNINKNKAEYSGSIKGTSIVIDIKLPVVLLKSTDNIGLLNTKRFAIFDEDAKKLILNNKSDEIVNLSKNIYDISIEHLKKEIEEEKNKAGRNDNFRTTKKKLTKKL